MVGGEEASRCSSAGHEPSDASPPEVDHRPETGSLGSGARPRGTRGWALERDVGGHGCQAEPATGAKERSLGYCARGEDQCGRLRGALRLAREKALAGAQATGARGRERGRAEARRALPSRCPASGGAGLRGLSTPGTGGAPRPGPVAGPHPRASHCSRPQEAPPSGSPSLAAEGPGPFLGVDPRDPARSGRCLPRSRYRCWGAGAEPCARSLNYGPRGRSPGEASVRPSG